MSTKKILLKSYRLEKYFKAYATKEDQQNEVFEKFKQVWGGTLANHILSKYDNAESLIWALDDNNLELFIKHF